jgi:putative endonuclease
MDGTDLRRGLGRRGEQLAAAHLERLGFDVLERNYRTRWGELDLVGFDGRIIVFCEVKTRRAGSGPPFEALHDGKQRRVRRMAASWLTERPDRPRADDLRFDAIGVTIDAQGALVAVDHLEAAF